MILMISLNPWNYSLVNYAVYLQEWTDVHLVYKHRNWLFDRLFLSPNQCPTGPCITIHLSLNDTEILSHYNHYFKCIFLGLYGQTNTKQCIILMGGNIMFFKKLFTNTNLKGAYVFTPFTMRPIVFRSHKIGKLLLCANSFRYPRSVKASEVC